MFRNESALRVSETKETPAFHRCRQWLQRQQQLAIAWSGFFCISLVPTLLPVSAQSVERDETVLVEPMIPDAASERVTDDEATVQLETAEKLLVRQTNKFRQSKGLERLTTDKQLAAAAEEFASYMARTDRYGHNADGRRPAQRARAAGYDLCIVAENIAYKFDSTGYQTEPLATRFVKGWKESPGHRENMLRPHVTQTGVAVARSDESGVYYAVQLFGRPRSAAIKFQIDNEADEIARYAIGNDLFTLPPRYRRTHRLCIPQKLQLLERSASIGSEQPSDSPTTPAAEQLEQPGSGKQPAGNKGKAATNNPPAASAGPGSPQKTVRTFLPADGAKYQFVVQQNGIPALIRVQADDENEETANNSNGNRTDNPEK